jgi:hypothetical protein
MARTMKFRVEEGDVRQTAADVLLLKYAQYLHGADRAVHEWLKSAGVRVRLPQPGEFEAVDGPAEDGPRTILFGGVKTLRAFGYAEMRQLATESLEHLALHARHAVARVACTVHGVGYGLDETESLRAMIGGFEDAIARGNAPKGLQEIVFVESVAARAQLLRATLDELHPPARPASVAVTGTGIEPPRMPAKPAEAKEHIFVAMPFGDDDLDDTYYLVTMPAIHSFGFLASRIDEETFTGDILEKITGKIAGARVVIADLTGANPNVYLEVGYAWGRSRRVILVAKEGTPLRFDVQSQRCIFYKNRRQLQERLARELETILELKE